MAEKKCKGTRRQQRAQQNVGFLRMGSSETNTDLATASPNPVIKLKTSDELDFSERWDLSDVTFVVEGKKVHASKTILAMWSPVMKAMFYQDFKEKGCSEVPLPGKKYEEILELMKVLHPPINQVNDRNVEILLRLAREYQMTSVTRKCEEFLCKSPSLAKLLLADEYSLTELQKVCLTYTKTRKFTELQNESGFEDLAKNTKINILTGKSGGYQFLLDAIADVLKRHTTCTMGYCSLFREISRQSCNTYIIRDIRSTMKEY